jgi:hypothetical protein
MPDMQALRPPGDWLAGEAGRRNFASTQRVAVDASKRRCSSGVTPVIRRNIAMKYLPKSRWQRIQGESLLTGAERMHSRQRCRGDAADGTPCHGVPVIASVGATQTRALRLASAGAKATHPRSDAR